MITQNLITYDQQNLQTKLSIYFSENEMIGKDISFKFITEFGSNKFSIHPLTSKNDWEKVKDELILEYDSLWQELAKS